MKNEDEKIKIAVTGDAWMRKGIGSIQSLMEDVFSKAKNEVLIVAYAISENQEFIGMLENMLVRGIRITITVNRFNGQSEGVKRKIRKLSSKYNNFIVFNFEPRSDLEDLHSKIIVVDHAYALVGSANFSTRGLFRNHELMVQLKGKNAYEIGNLIDTLIKSRNISHIQF